MANQNIADGLTPVSPNPRKTKYTNGGTAVKRGDVVGLASGLVAFFVPTTHIIPLGVVAFDAAADAEVYVYDDLDGTEFKAQFEGSYTAESNGLDYDLKGTTGIIEIDGATTLYGTVRVLRQYAQNGSNEVATNAKVVCRLNNAAAHFKARPTFYPSHAVSVPTLAGNVTITAVTPGENEIAWAQIMKIDPDGSARDVTLGATLHTKGRTFRIANAAGGAENLVIKNSGGSTIVTLNQNEGADLVYDGSAWQYVHLTLAT